MMTNFTCIERKKASFFFNAITPVQDSVNNIQLHGGSQSKSDGSEYPQFFPLIVGRLHQLYGHPHSNHIPRQFAASVLLSSPGRYVLPNSKAIQTRGVSIQWFHRAWIPHKHLGGSQVIQEQ